MKSSLSVILSKLELYDCESVDARLFKETKLIHFVFKLM